MTGNTNCGSGDTCGAPVWTWTTTGNPSEIAFGCNPCTNQTIYAYHRSDQFRDIRLQVSTDGFFSDPLPYTVYVPYKILLTAYADGAKDDGFITTAILSLYDKFGDEITGLATNENFEQTSVADYPNMNWPSPQPSGAPAGWPTLKDDMYVTGCTQAYPHCANPSIGNPRSTTKVVHNVQDWYSGSPIPGQGLEIRNDTQQYYLDNARYFDEVSPLDP